MWLSLIEKREALLAIYQDEVPDLENLFLHEIKITTGKDLIINIRFDLGEFPKKIPKKWLDRNINTVQITLDLIQAKIEEIDLEKAISSVDSIIIEQISDYKRITLRDASKAEVLTIRSTWIYLSSLNGYQNTYNLS
ncbi:Imm50 family immunity protein [Dyadobacter sp. NIV53]|uniref:Imm50 family immunity protein n=1 Tax=Dyadobacter sp. NIV53 TaxID=2861765 RepID=UPI001C88A5E2|nr:Imm50 family immunity protein [Dyadobacter sp. NIV53]